MDHLRFPLAPTTSLPSVPPNCPSDCQSGTLEYVSTFLILVCEEVLRITCLLQKSDSDDGGVIGFGLIALPIVSFAKSANGLAILGHSFSSEFINFLLESYSYQSRMLLFVHELAGGISVAIREQLEL
ncbi:hypothetical protein Tco_0932702 [Tanacetum coccineum]